MRLPKLTRKKKTVRNLLVILLLLLLLWGAGGFRSLTLDGAVRREAARYFTEPGEKVVTIRKGFDFGFGDWMFDHASNLNALVLTHRDGYVHAYMCQGWPLRSADYMGAYPVEEGKCVIKIPHGGTSVGQMNWDVTMDGEAITIRIEERRRDE